MTKDIDGYHPFSGRFVKEDGTTVNIADELGGKSVSDKVYDIDNMMPHSGRFIKEDGTCVNIADMIANGDIGGGSGSGSSDDSAPPITETYNGQTIQCSMSADRPLQGLNLYATCEQKTTTGAQLWDVEKAKKPESWTGKADYRYFDIQLKSNTTYCLFVSENNMHNDYKAEYIDKFAFYIGETPNRIDLNILFGNCNVDKGAVLLNKIFTTTENPFYFNLYLSSWDEKNLNIVFDEILKNIMLVEGSSALPYEPYTGGIPSPNVDYPQEIQTTSDFVVEVKNSMEADAAPQTLNITIPEQGFYGIPVSSGGNYTDASGKQWICDEFDFANKKFIKRIGKASFNGSVEEHWVSDAATENYQQFYVAVPNGKENDGRCLCNRFIYKISNQGRGECSFWKSRFYARVEPSINTVALWRDYLNTHQLDVIYTLETPVEYDLTDEQVEQYKKLRSYYGTTYIDNNAVPVCNMQAGLILDTKLYIDSKFTTLAGQILEMGV